MFKALLLASLSFEAFADEWTTKDTLLESTYVVFHTIDWRQTQDISKHLNMREKNPILGKHPTNAKINTYFASTLALQYGIAKLLPSDLRTIWLLSGITLEYSVTKSNKQIGLQVNF